MEGVSLLAVSGRTWGRLWVRNESHPQTATRDAINHLRFDFVFVGVADLI